MIVDITVRRAQSVLEPSRADVWHMEALSRKGKRWLREHVGASTHVATLTAEDCGRLAFEADVERGFTVQNEETGAVHSKAARRMQERLGV